MFVTKYFTCDFYLFGKHLDVCILHPLPNTNVRYKQSAPYGTHDFLLHLKLQNKGTLACKTAQNTVSNFIVQDLPKD